MVSGSHLRRRGALALLLAVLVLLGLAAGTGAADSLRDGRGAPSSGSERFDGSGVEAGARDVIVIGAPGLSWKDVTEDKAPAITSFAAGAAVANLNVRSTYFTSCPTDGWLGLSAGTRAAEPRDVTRGELRSDPRALPHCSPLPTLPDPGPELMAVEMDHGYWQDLAKGVAAQGFDARIGTLASTVHEAGGCIDGSGAGAVLAMADRDAYYGDADVDLDWLLSEDYAASRRTLIADAASDDFRPGPDRNGNVPAFTPPLVPEVVVEAPAEEVGVVERPERSDEHRRGEQRVRDEVRARYGIEVNDAGADPEAVRQRIRLELDRAERDRAGGDAERGRSAAEQAEVEVREAAAPELLFELK